VAVGGYLVGGAGGDDLAAAGAAAGAEVDDVVGVGDQAEVVVYDDHRRLRVEQPVQGPDQSLDVARVQADAGFVEDVYRPRLVGVQPGGQAQPLRLATGQGGCRLAEGQVAETDLLQRDERAADRPVSMEMLSRLVDGHREHVRDRLAIHRDPQRLLVVPASAAFVAADDQVRKVLDVQCELAKAVAHRALAFGGVVGELPGFQARLTGVAGADGVEGTTVRRWGGPGVRADGVRVDLNHAGDAGCPQMAHVFWERPPSKGIAQRRYQAVQDEGGLP
jgi:hypothetical protein